MAALVNVLRVGGVEVQQDAKSFVVRLDQPYRAHAKDLLEVQRFPRMERVPGGPVERPYDVAGWTLPLQMGVDVVALDSVPANLTPVTDSSSARCPALHARLVGLPASNTESYRGIMAAIGAGVPVETVGEHFVFPRGNVGTTSSDARLCFDAIDQARPKRSLKKAPRIGLYRSWTASMDEGWTRWLFEQFSVPFTTVRDSTIKAGNLRATFDVIVMPDMSRQEIVRGLTAQQTFPEYAGGLGDGGLAHLKAFVSAGGRVILLDGSSEIAAELGVTGVELVGAGAGNAREAPYAPGSILRTQVNKTNPLALGMRDEAAVYFTNSLTFDVRGDSNAQVVLRYPAANEILLSGYLSGAEAMAGRAAMLDARVGPTGGRVIMFGFRPQHRGQPWGTFRLLFNALLL